MKKFIALMLCLLMLVPTCLAEGKLSVTQKNLFVFDGKDSGYFYAKVENTGDAPIGVDSGSLVAFSPDDEIVVTQDYITAYPGRVLLEPGEYVYVNKFLWDSALKDSEISDYKFSLDSKENATEVVDVPCEVSLDLQGADSYDNYIYVTFTNPSEETVYGFFVTVALTDEQGDLIFVDGDSADNLGVHAGSTVTVKIYVDNDLMEYYEAHQLKPSSVDAMVCYAEE